MTKVSCSMTNGALDITGRSVKWHSHMKIVGSLYIYKHPSSNFTPKHLLEQHENIWSKKVSMNVYRSFFHKMLETKDRINVHQ